MNASTVILTTVSDALVAFKEFTGDMDVQVQAIQTFLLVSTRDSLSVEELAKIIGLNQSTASRNIKKLAVGPYQQEGYGLITIELDMYDQRRRILKLSARGHELVRFIETKVAPKLRYHFAKEFGVKQS
jgi:DNA-binding MarR family transcriptional regulator